MVISCTERTPYMWRGKLRNVNRMCGTNCIKLWRKLITIWDVTHPNSYYWGVRRLW